MSEQNLQITISLASGEVWSTCFAFANPKDVAETLDDIFGTFDSLGDLEESLKGDPEMPTDDNLEEDE